MKKLPFNLTIFNYRYNVTPGGWKPQSSACRRRVEPRGFLLFDKHDVWAGWGQEYAGEGSEGPGEG